jgi:GAF domain-containing protein
VVQYPDGFVESLRALSGLMVDEESLDHTLQRVVTLACISLSGCDMASVTLEDGRTRTAACTDKIALAMDESQYAADAGPCLQAARTGSVIDLPAIAEDQRWPAFAAAANEHGVVSSLSLPLIHRGQPRGAFNLYARTPQAFTADDRAHGTLFARQAAVAIANAEVYWRTYDLTQNLQAALHNRDLIGQAKGILMARHGITAEDAFDELRRASQRRNVKLHDIADDVARTGASFRSIDALACRR